MARFKIDQNILSKVPTKFEEFVDKVYEYEEMPDDTDSPASRMYSAEKLAELNRKIKKEILYLTLQKSYYGELIPFLNIFGSTELDPKTMCTNGTDIMFHPEFIEKQSPEAIRMVLAHEILHCVGEHFARRGDRDPDLWNIATDYAINPILQNEPGFSWPLGEDGSRMGLYEEKFEGMRAEDIYDELLKKYGGKPPPKLIKQSGMGGVVDDDTPMPKGDPGLQIQQSINQPGDGEDGESPSMPKKQPGSGEKPGSGSGDSEPVKPKPQGQKPNGDKGTSLPQVGQRVRLSDGTEAVIKKVLPSGDIEI